MGNQPIKNKHQSVRSESSSNYRYRQIRSYQKRINDLQKALQELVDEMEDPKKVSHYQDLIDEKVKKYRPFKKTSNFRGVSWFNPRKLWRSRIHVAGEEIVDYHETELEAARAYDRKAKEFFPDCPHYRNFLDDGEKQKDMKKPRVLTVPEKRKIIGQRLTTREIKAIHPMGIGYFNKDQCEVALRYIEKKEGVKIG